MIARLLVRALNQIEAQSGRDYKLGGNHVMIFCDLQMNGEAKA